MILRGCLDGGDEILEVFATDEAARRVFAGDEFLHDLGRAVIDRDFEAVIRNVKGEVFAHDCKSDESGRLRGCCCCCHFIAPIQIFATEAQWTQRTDGIELIQQF